MPVTIIITFVIIVVEVARALLLVSVVCIPETLVYQPPNDPVINFCAPRVSNVIEGARRGARMHPNMLDGSGHRNRIHLAVRVGQHNVRVVHVLGAKVHPTADELRVGRCRFILVPLGQILAFYFTLTHILTHSHRNIDISMCLDVRIEAQSCHELELGGTNHDRHCFEQAQVRG